MDEEIIEIMKIIEVFADLAVNDLLKSRKNKK